MMLMVFTSAPPPDLSRLSPFHFWYVVWVDAQWLWLTSLLSLFRGVPEIYALFNIRVIGEQYHVRSTWFVSGSVFWEMETLSHTHTHTRMPWDNIIAAAAAECSRKFQRDISFPLWIFTFPHFHQMGSTNSIMERKSCIMGINLEFVMVLSN